MIETHRPSASPPPASHPTWRRVGDCRAPHVLGGAPMPAATDNWQMQLLDARGNDQAGPTRVPGPRCPGLNRHRMLVALPRRQRCEPLSANGFVHAIRRTGTQLLRLQCGRPQRQAIAERQAVAIATVGTQIACIWTKTDTTSVCALIQRVARLPPIRCVHAPGPAAGLA